MTRQIKRIIFSVMAFAALAVGGAAIAGAAGTGTTTTGTTTTPHGYGPPHGFGPPHGYGPPPGFTSADAPGTAAHEKAEKAVTGADAEKAIAAALATVSGGKAGSVTTTFRGGGYEVDVTKADGTKVTVHLDSSFKVQTHPMGPGGPGMGGPPPGAGAPQSQGAYSPEGNGASYQ